MCMIFVYNFHFLKYFIYVQFQPHNGLILNNFMETRTKEKPWKLKTPPLTSDYEMYLDEKDEKKVIVCVVGKTILLYDLNALRICMLCLNHMPTGWN